MNEQIRKAAKDLLEHIDLETDCMSNIIKRQHIDIQIDALEFALKEPTQPAMSFSVQELRPEVLAYALLMEQALRDKDADKGDSWKHSSIPNLKVSVLSKSSQLARTHFEGAAEAPALLQKHAVDLGNYCMMVVGLAGGLQGDSNGGEGWAGIDRIDFVLQGRN